MSTQQPSLRARRASRNRAGKLMFAGSLTLVCSIFVYSIISMTSPRDTKNLCAADGKIEALHFVLVDKTDPFGPNFLTQVRHFILSEAKSTKIDERIEVFAIRGTHNKRFPADLSLCNPGRGADYNKFTNNQRTKESFYQSAFLGEIQKLADGMTASDEASQSPILEVIEDITTRPEVQKFEGPKRIVLVSDMAQNSKFLRFVRERKVAPVTEEQIRRGIGKIAGGKGLQFQGFSFEVYQVEMEYDHQVLDHVKEKWEGIIRGNGGELAHWGDL